MIVNLRKTQADDLPALYGILALCGEYMYRTQGLDHWYPFSTLDWFVQELYGKDTYGIYSDDILAGTFTLSPVAPIYDEPRFWADPDAQALYFIAFAILPSYQKQGLGTWALRQVNRIMNASGYPYMRFDAEASNVPLVRYYEKRGYDNRGLLQASWGNVVCFECAYPWHPGD